MIRRSSRNHRRSLPKWQRYWWILPVAVVVGCVGWLATGPEWSRPRSGKPTQQKLPPGYVTAFAKVTEEYQRFHAKPLTDPTAAGQFDEATEHMLHHEYAATAELLEAVVKKAAVPAVFNNLGLTYLALNDRGQAIHSFREALARDMDYQPVHENLERIKEIDFADAMPMMRENEPNNTLALANTIAAGRPVEGEIMASVNDTDCYKVVTPGAPRDSLRIEVVPHSPSLGPMLRIFDAERRVLHWVKGKEAPGQPISVIFAPPPNSTLWLELSGAEGSAGLYTLRVTPLRWFDAFEPNDDIFSAHPIQIGMNVDAGIMDGSDTDFYSFEASKAGTVKITVKNRSATLVPALTTYSPEMRSSGFAPDASGPGGNLEHRFAVEANRKYFVQVWSQSDTAGEYTLRIEQ